MTKKGANSIPGTFSQEQKGFTVGACESSLKVHTRQVVRARYKVREGAKEEKRDEVDSGTRQAWPVCIPRP